jgi:hypothetical protein
VVAYLFLLRLAFRLLLAAYVPLRRARAALRRGLEEGLRAAEAERRRHRLARGLAREVELHRGAEDALLVREGKQYLVAVPDALAGADAARVVLAGVVRRMEGD